MAQSKNSNTGASIKNARQETTFYENNYTVRVDMENSNDSSAANSKKGIKVPRAEIQAHFDQIQECLDENDAGHTGHAFHQADTAAHKIRDLCKLETAQ